MTTIEAGTRVNKGYYFSATTWSLEPVVRDGEALPGKLGERYLRVPLLAAFALAPIMGAVFLMFLPFIGFYLAAHAAVRPVTRLFGRSATEIAATIQPGWKPGEAYLTGHGQEAPTAEDGAVPAEDGLAELEREIEAKRTAQK